MSEGLHLGAEVSPQCATGNGCARTHALELFQACMLVLRMSCGCKSSFIYANGACEHTCVPCGCAKIAWTVCVVCDLFLALVVCMALPCRVFGAQSLKSIAAAVLQRSLTQRLDSLEAAETSLDQQEPAGPSSSQASCGTAPAQGGKPRCSVVCVQACSSEESDTGASQTLPQARRGSADVDLIVVQTDVSVGTTPASSRAASPDADNGLCPTAPVHGSCGSAFAAPICAPPAGSDSLRPRTVTFSTVDRQESDDSVADAAACCAEAAGALRHALTTASSSGWYDELCCVCWESEVTAVMEPCMHAMCLGCARQLVGCSGTVGPSCPLCRAFIAGFGQVPQSVRQQAGKRKKCLLAGAGI